MVQKKQPVQVRYQILFVILLVSLLLSACSPATPPPNTPPPASTQTDTPTLPPTPVPPSPTVEPSATPSPQPAASTSTPEPTVTPTETATPTSSPTTQAPLALAGTGISAWCQPAEQLVMALQYKNPPDARIASVVNNQLEINNLPASSCMLFFAFNQPISAEILKGVKFQIYDLVTKTPWFEGQLTPIEFQPGTAGIRLTHSYIIAPPFWDVSYKFVLKAADGSQITSFQANLHRWKPDKCYNGEYPSLKTMLCPLWEDLHPWDPAYGKIIPTHTPKP